VSDPVRLPEQTLISRHPKFQANAFYYLEDFDPKPFETGLQQVEKTIKRVIAWLRQ
jgi:hypothetical protein